MSMSRKDLDILRPMVDRAVQKFLGFSESTLVTAAVNCVDKGYDRKKTRDKLSSILDDGQASRFTEKLFEVVDEFGSSSKKSSRKRKEGEKERDVKTEEFVAPPEAKKVKKFEDVAVPSVPEPGKPSPGQLTADKIKEMMANAQRMIQERKKQLQTVLPPVPTAPSQQAASVGEIAEKEKRARDLQAKIQAQLANAGLANTTTLGVGTVPSKVAAAMSKPAPVILDEMGRTIDAKTGEAVTFAHHMPTLKANIRAKRREQFKYNLSEKAPEDIAESKFFDSRVWNRAAGRTKRSFRFHEHGKFQQLAQRMRTKAQLEKLQADIAQTAKKTGIASAAKLATIAPKKELREGEIPDVEWWDNIILRGESYENVLSPEGDVLTNDCLEGITRLVEHPLQMKPPDETDKTITIPVMLTKQERKKLRRQTRNEAQKETQEKIRLGLEPPPEPKVRMANLMRVLGNEAVQDPTKVEAHVRAQMAKRQKAHEEANATRKLTTEQRRDKKVRKIKEDTTAGVQVSVYRVRNLGNQAKKFKIEANSKQLFMTGFVVLFKDCNVVVVEGGPKQQKKFRHLMLHRIKWAEDKHKEKGEEKGTGPDGETEKKVNKCDLVWEGMVKNRAFSEIIFKACPTETYAREQLKKHGVEQYWDLAYSGAVLEAAGESL